MIGQSQGFVSLFKALRLADKSVITMQTLAELTLLAVAYDGRRNIYSGNSE